MRRRLGRPGLVGTMARTAVVAGTATAVNNRMTDRHYNKAAASQQEDAAQQAAFDSQAQMADMQRQMDAMKAQQGGAAPAAPAGGTDVVAELQKLAALKEQGILSDAEFAAAKAKLLA